MLQLISDVVLLAAAIFACVYCIVLSKRLKKFSNLESGVGGAVTILSVRVEELTKILEAAQLSAESSAKTLSELVAKAEQSSRKIELQTASLHDLPEVLTQQPKDTLEVAGNGQDIKGTEPIFARRARAGGRS